MNVTPKNLHVVNDLQYAVGLGNRPWIFYFPMGRYYSFD